MELDTLVILIMRIRRNLENKLWMTYNLSNRELSIALNSLRQAV